MKQPTTINKFHVQTPQFDGPLDLLLHLIEREELDITAISLAQVTQQFLDQVKAFKESRVERLIDFIVVAARLVLIKSRALLPKIPALPGEGEEEEDPAEALLRQLRAYKRFKQAAKWLGDREKWGLRTYLRIAPPPKVAMQLDLRGITLEVLLTAVQSALLRVSEREESVAIIQPRRITIEGQIKRLRHRIKSKKPMTFLDMLSPSTNRVEVAITLLALLELIKRRELQASQSELFGPIQITAAEQAAVPV